jgi:hypothetical protein
MERGLADVLTLGFVFTALISSATLLLLWANLPLRLAEERQDHLRCNLLYFALLNFKPDHELTLPQQVVENLLGIPRRELPENFVIEVFHFWVGARNGRVRISIENKNWEVRVGAPKSRFYRSEGKLSLLPAGGEPLMAKVEVEFG